MMQQEKKRLLMINFLIINEILKKLIKYINIRVYD
jgi:hypothetical protein